MSECFSWLWDNEYNRYQWRTTAWNETFVGEGKIVGASHHFAIVGEPEKGVFKLTFYLDGVAVWTKTSSSSWSENPILRLGYNMSGYFDEVRVWSKAFSSEDIQNSCNAGPDAALYLAPVPISVDNLVYNGQTQVGVTGGIGCDLSMCVAAANAGEYVASATLKDGYRWSDGCIEKTRMIHWSIAKATNSWLTQPSLSSTEFYEGSAVTINRGAVKFGICQANYTATELTQLTAGSYTLMVSVVETSNYTGLTKSIPFAVMDRPAISKLYCVIDLSAGALAKNYPVKYVDAEPSGGWGAEYKTTKLVLRRVKKGSFSMLSEGKTSISKDFYVGVFEVTQKQYELVMGTNPASGYGVGDTLPVYNVSYDDIRGSSMGAGWPTSVAVDSWSFLGKLRARTSIDFDLPTEAQWEYACRAGTTGKYYWTDAGLASSICAWYIINSSGIVHNVGAKRSNDWGLYDMSGNVSEWCRDWYSSTLTYGNDPKGATSASYNRRVTRGGCYSSGESDLRMDDSVYRYGSDASSRSSSNGFRIVMPEQA